jgi:adenosine deaminase
MLSKTESLEGLKEFSRRIPKCELHLHIEGTLEPEVAFELSKKNKIPLKYTTIEELRDAYKFKDLQSFLDIYYECASVLVTAEDFELLAWEYFQKCKRDNIVHAEIFFDPQTHTKRNIPFSIFMRGFKQAIDRARAELQVSSALIMCFLRDLSEEDAFKTLEEAEPYLDHEYIVKIHII